MDLTDIERIILDGLAARDREVVRDHIAPLQRDTATFLRAVEARLGLEVGAIGTTHVLDAASLAVVEVPRPSSD